MRGSSAQQLKTASWFLYSKSMNRTMTLNNGASGRVHAVRLPRVVTDELDKVADEVGGYGKAIELLATQPALPRDWFQENRGKIRSRRDTRITFRLASRAEHALPACGGRRPRTKIFLHVTIYHL